MRKRICAALALITLAATAPASARGHSYSFFATHARTVRFFQDHTPKKDRVTLLPADRVPVWVMKRYTVHLNGRTFHIFRIMQKMKCDNLSADICVPVLVKP